VINARYGKPGFVNPSGVGIGEAYLVRGATDLAGRRFNLNQVGSESLPGVIFTGPRTESNDETYGISTVFLSSDADGDNLGELWFGVPFTNSVVRDPRQNNVRDTRRNIEREGMFVNGGVVCVSSQKQPAYRHCRFRHRGQPHRVGSGGDVLRREHRRPRTAQRGPMRGRPSLACRFLGIRKW
jgi:hypothetical protein